MKKHTDQVQGAMAGSNCSGKGPPSAGVRAHSQLIHRAARLVAYALAAVLFVMTAATVAQASPNIQAISRETPTSEHTNADVLTWKITFSEPVASATHHTKNVDPTDFKVSGTTATLTLTPLALDEEKCSEVWHATLSGGDLADLNGTVTIEPNVIVKDGLDFDGHNPLEKPDIWGCIGDGEEMTNPGPLGQNDNTFVLDNPDNPKPEVTITGVPQRTTSTFTATFTFDETVSGFEAADVTVTGGTKGTFAEVTSSRVWTLVVTPSADYSLAVAADVAHDVDGNGNVAATASGEYAEPPPTPQVTISAGTSPVTEGTAATFAITANPAPTTSLAVNVDVSETGNVMSGIPPSSVTISADDSSATLTVATDDDQADESNGVVTAEVATGTGYTVGSSSSASVTVQDNDDPAPPTTPQVTISAGTSPVTEGTPATFTITANPAPTTSLTVNVDVSGTGNVMSGRPPSSVTINADQSSATLTVATDDDQADESNGEVTAEVATGTGYTVGSSSSASVTVEDNDDPAPPPPTTPQVTISAGTSPVTEGTAATFTITANPAPTTSLTVNVDVSETGNVMSGTPPSSVTINADESSATLTVATDDDQADESNGEVTAEVAAGTGYTVGSSSSASVTVEDNDEPAPSSSLSAPTVTRALATSMAVNWAPPTGSVVSSYDLRYRQSGATDFIDGPQDVTGTRTIISGLNPNTVYEIQVRASNSAGDGDWSELGTVRTSTLIASDRFSLSLDVDDSDDDQFMSFLSVAPDSLVSIQIFGRSLKAIPVDDLSVRFEYDATQVAYERFRRGPVLSGASALAGQDLANVGMTLPDSVARVDSGLVGTIRFRATDALSETEIRMAQVELLRGEESDTIPLFLSVALQGSSLGLSSSDPSPDFNGNGTVDTPDFLLFVDVFGLKAGQERYEARYDLDRNDEIGFPDFLIFVLHFGKVVPRVPVFTSAPPVTRFIEENTPSGPPIGEPISATSADGEPLTYSLWGVDAGYFAIDASTGQLETKGTYNFEERNWYSPIVRVSGEKGGRVSIVVGIAIIDVAE